ncbi:hypothetical protein RFI_14873 [Reticulomyxa filosa]|uniref:Uncharacterized protein n=1 Tax=Reticulomyxa filosa TaxID=46433 RepID=X6NAJ1_RETFI|nr:hypothetical protein RFI_14873 [Reticulomyxa filosa]|eukprot:ETO22327.1 hypothetical protein RFI_14873 [Reticulomyxa filosa]
MYKYLYVCMYLCGAKKKKKKKKKKGFFLSCGEPNTTDDKDNTSKTIFEYCIENARVRGLNVAIFLRLVNFFYYSCKPNLQVIFSDTISNDFSLLEIDNETTQRASSFLIIPLKYGERFFAIRQAVLEQYLLKGIPPRMLTKKMHDKSQDRGDKSVFPRSNPIFRGISSGDVSELLLTTAGKKERTRRLTNANSALLSMNSSSAIDETTPGERKLELIFSIRLWHNVGFEELQLLMAVLDGQHPQCNVEQINQLDNLIVRLGMDNALNDYLEHTMKDRESIENTEEKNSTEAKLLVRSYEKFVYENLDWHLTPQTGSKSAVISLEDLRIFGIESLEMTLGLECSISESSSMQPQRYLSRFASTSEYGVGAGATAITSPRDIYTAEMFHNIDPDSALSLNKEVCELFFSDGVWNTWPIPAATIRVNYIKNLSLKTIPQFSPFQIRQLCFVVTCPSQCKEVKIRDLSILIKFWGAPSPAVVKVLMKQFEEIENQHKALAQAEFL